ncbi:Ig-like domain-containing protein [Marinobacter sp. KM021]|uniref:Ig-like domain-containing protein n=1 Tax=Marinobacter TaxID=2742 RepID=UPI001E653393|nr:Ig-like domain-containing protein [Marinobacter shengliensis]MCD1629510.1 Ig-like domain-containing protein [Marinobacter shengliensis]
MKKTTIALIVTTALAGCGDSGDQQTVTRAPTPGSLTFTYPADSTPPGGDQPGVTSTVPTTTPVFLRFNKSIDTPLTDIPDSLILRDATGNEVTLTDVMFTDEDKMGLAAKPDKALAPGTSYTLTAEGLQVGGAPVSLTADGIKFKTAPATSGPLLSQTEGTGFELARTIPDGGSDYPVTDFTTFRLQFTEPVDPQSVVYGQTIRLTDQAGEPVNAEVYVKGHRVTVDPEGYLDPAQTYNLTVTSGIKSALLGDTLSEDHTLTFNPVDSRSPTGKRQIMAQVAESIPGQLPLTGADYNSVNLSSLLLGPNNPTSVTGTVFAELGFIPRFEAAGQSIPLRIDRGTLLTGSSVVVKVAGAVPAGFESEAVEVRFLSDANGFLMPNPYTDAVDAPRVLELYIDMALNTGNTVANGALGQQLMHVQLVGTAIVEDGKLSIEAVGVIEPDVMGIDTASGLISFKLNGFRNVEDAPLQADFADTAAPFIKSWVPGEHSNIQRPSDPLIVYFSEPLLPSSINPDNITLIANDGTTSAEVAFKSRLDGPALVIRPTEPLTHGIDYTLTMDGLVDLSGNPMASTSRNFRLDPTAEVPPADVGPIALTTLPGYPCAKTDLDAQPGKQGRCLGGITSQTPASANFGQRPLDDLLPITEHPASEPIIVRFSQDIDPDSIVAGETVVVEKQDENGSWQSVEGYSLSLLNGRELRAVPLDKWEQGTNYRYVLTDGITNQQGIPLYSRLLSQYADPGRSLGDLSSGGQPLENRFVARDITKTSVLLPLKNLPSRDVNANLKLDPEEPDAISGIPENSMKLAITEISSGVLEDNGQIGCEVGTEACDEFKKFIFLTANLDVEIVGEPTVAEDGSTRVPVKLHPSVLLTTPSDIWVNLSSQLLAVLATSDLQTSQEFDTGPLALRMRYQGENRDGLIDGVILQKDGQLTFETELDVYLDAPYLNVRLSGLANTRLEDNLRSYPINGLKLSGPITFLDDGRIVIEQRNVEPIVLSTRLLGRATVGLLEEESAICSIGTGLLCRLLGGVVNGVVNSVIDVDTELTIQVAPNELQLRYVSPYTQK